VPVIWDSLPPGRPGTSARAGRRVGPERHKSALHRDAKNYSGPPLPTAIASLPLLRIIFRLNVGVAIDFIDASLLRETRLAVPCIGAPLDLAEFFHREAAPVTYSIG
jgi:hypothetical protein